jgi:hypothetical protein
VFNTSKPPGAPLAESIVIRARGETVAVAVEDENQISMPAWSGLFGATLEISADIVSTNGVASPFSVERTVVDVKPVSSPYEAALGAVDGVVFVGEGTALLPPGDAGCNDGCVDIGSNGGFAFALTGAQATSLVLRYTGGAVEASFGMVVSTTPARLTLAVPGNLPEVHILSSVSELTDSEFALPRAIAPDEAVYGLVTGAYGSVQIQPGDGCNLLGAGSSVYVERVELVE